MSFVHLLGLSMLLGALPLSADEHAPPATPELPTHHVVIEAPVNRPVGVGTSPGTKALAANYLREAAVDGILIDASAVRVVDTPEILTLTSTDAPLERAEVSYGKTGEISVVVEFGSGSDDDILSTGGVFGPAWPATVAYTSSGGPSTASVRETRYSGTACGTVVAGEIKSYWKKNRPSDTEYNKDYWSYERYTYGTPKLNGQPAGCIYILDYGVGDLEILSTPTSSSGITGMPQWKPMGSLSLNCNSTSLGVQLTVLGVQFGGTYGGCDTVASTSYSTYGKLKTKYTYDGYADLGVQRTVAHNMEVWTPQGTIPGWTNTSSATFCYRYCWNGTAVKGTGS